VIIRLSGSVAVLRDLETALKGGDAVAGAGFET
jgi:hypothetical protein